MPGGLACPKSLIRFWGIPGVWLYNTITIKRSFIEHQGVRVTPIGVLISILLLLVLAAMLFPLTMSDGRYSPRTHCLSNLKNSALGCIMYASDYDDRMPMADQWADLTSKFRRSEGVLHDPALGKNEYGYAFRNRASSMAISSVKKPMSFILMFDSTVRGRNAQSELWSLPYPGRHSGSNNGVFLDGHAKSKIGIPPERTQK